MVAAGVVPSLSEARRVIRQGGAYLNNRKIEDEKYVPLGSDFLHGKYLVIRRGRKAVGAYVLPWDAEPGDQITTLDVKETVTL
jgi:tyrosyl-tRNA synthetase